MGSLDTFVNNLFFCVLEEYYVLILITLNVVHVRVTIFSTLILPNVIMLLVKGNSQLYHTMCTDNFHLV